MSIDAYVPSEWGKWYHGLACREALGAGSAGPGKSMILLHDCDARIHMEHERCLLPTDHPHYHPFGASVGKALHLRRQNNQLAETIRRSFRSFRSMDTNATFDRQSATWTFSSGYQYQFGHCKDPDDWGNYQSAEYDWIGFDELTQFEEEQYVQICTRLRSSDQLLRGMLKVRSMSNPRSCWVREYFIDPAPEGNKLLVKKIAMSDGTVEKVSRIYLPARLSDNPDKEFVKSYELTLRDKPMHIRRALLDGDWYVQAGSFFGESWRRELHVCKPFRVPDDWIMFRSMDWGFKTHGCVHWWAMDFDDTMWCVREFSFRKMHAAEVAKRIRQIERDEFGLRGTKSPITGPADTQLWEERGSSAMTKANEMANEGVLWTQADKSGGSRKAGCGKLMKRLDGHNHGTTTPGIVFFDTCTQAIKTIPGIATDPDDKEVPEDGGDDHWLDSVRYAVTYASHGRRGLAKSVNRGVDEDDDFPTVSDSDRGKYGYGLH
jgi:hypothetical protein